MEPHERECPMCKGIMMFEDEYDENDELVYAYYQCIDCRYIESA